MNMLFRIKSYCEYQLRAQGISNVHSPFVFDFMRKVLHDRHVYSSYSEIEDARKELLQSPETINVLDYGAGNAPNILYKKRISDIVRSAVKPPGQAQLLFRIAGYFQCNHIIELGTSLGITARYLSASGKNAKVITLEGAPEIAAYASRSFEKAGIKNITLIQGRFEHTLKLALDKFEKTDLVFFDGNHRKSATLNYFNLVLPHLHEKSVLIFDDIYWSAEMKEAWQHIITCREITLSIDLFHFGIVLFNNQLSKQNFVLRW